MIEITQKELIQMGVALLAGGAFGAILKGIFDLYQKRIQPVGYKIGFVKIFKDTLGNSSLNTELQVTDGIETRHFKNLYIAEITIKNRGNTHIDEFNFGITLGGDDVAIYTQTVTQDRHHIVNQLSQVALGATAKEIDFTCKPFNRKDEYFFRVFISIPTHKKEPEDIKLGSPHPIKFVDLDELKSKYTSVGVSMLNAAALAYLGEKKRVKSD